MGESALAVCCFPGNKPTLLESWRSLASSSWIPRWRDQAAVGIQSPWILRHSEIHSRCRGIACACHSLGLAPQEVHQGSINTPGTLSHTRPPTPWCGGRCLQFSSGCSLTHIFHGGPRGPELSFFVVPQSSLALKFLGGVPTWHQPGLPMVPLRWCLDLIYNLKDTIGLGGYGASFRKGAGLKKKS